MKPALPGALAIAIGLCASSAPRLFAQPPAAPDRNPPPVAAEPSAQATPGAVPGLAARLEARQRRMNRLIESGHAPGMMGGAMGAGARPGMAPMMMTPICPSFSMMPSDATTRAQWMQTCGRTLQLWGEWMEKRGRELEHQPPPPR